MKMNKELKQKWILLEEHKEAEEKVIRLIKRIYKEGLSEECGDLDIVDTIFEQGEDKK